MRCGAGGGFFAYSELPKGQTNISIRVEIGGMATLHQQIMQQKTSYFGHVLRGDGLENDIMLGMVEGKRKAGRPRRRWIDERAS